MSDVLFMVPEYWPALLLLPMLLLAMFWLARRCRRRQQQDVGARLAAVAGAPRWSRCRLAADVGALLAIGIALLQPVAPGDEGDSGADVVLCVDVSWSMAARDQAPSRLAAVQREIGGLLGIDPASRVALVAYAGDASLVAPLTADVEAAVSLANDLLPGAHGTAGTDPGAAIDVAASLLARAGRAGAIVVLSDGEDFAGRAVDAAARAAMAGCAVFALGCGDEAGSKIVVADADGEAFLQDGAGVDVVSRLELANLRALVAAGGGEAQRLQAGALRALHDDVLLPNARAVAVRAGRLQPIHLYPWPLLLAVGLWMLRQCLPERRR